MQRLQPTLHLGAMLACFALGCSREEASAKRPTASSPPPPSAALNASEPNLKTDPSVQSQATIRFELDWPKGDIGWLQLTKKRGQGAKVSVGQATWSIAVEEFDGDSFAVAWKPRADGTLAEALRRAVFLPRLTVSRDGATSIVAGELEAYIDRLAAMSPQKLPPATLAAVGDVTALAFTQTWAAAVSSWPGQELELGKTHKNLRSSMMPHVQSVPVTEWTTVRGFIPCTTSETGPRCVGISIRNEISEGAAKSLLQDVPSAFGGKAFTADEMERIGAQSITLTTFVLLDPQRTMPYRIVIDRSHTTTADGVRSESIDYEEWLFHYTATIR